MSGPLTPRVLEYERVMKELVGSAKAPEDWAPLAELVAVEEFERVGTFLEVQDWPSYVRMLTRWAGSIDTFETSVVRTSEAGDLVFYEIEERHVRGAEVTVVRSMTVFAFDRDGRIRHLDVYLQQPPKQR